MCGVSPQEGLAIMVVFVMKGMPATRIWLRQEEKQPTSWRQRDGVVRMGGEPGRRGLEGSRIRPRMYREPSGAAQLLEDMPQRGSGWHAGCSGMLKDTQVPPICQMRETAEEGEGSDKPGLILALAT